jgi:hypothetical protein
MTRPWPGLVAAALAWWIPLVARAEGPALKAIRAGVRVDLSTGRTIDPPGDLRDLELDLAKPVRAARDEVIALQVRIDAEKPAVLAASVELVGPEGQASSLVSQIFVERPIAVSSPSRSEKIFSLGPASYPDVLVPTATVAVLAAPQPSLLWIDVYVPRDAPVGLHRGKIRVGKDGLPLAIEVLPLSLPKADRARLGAVSFGSFLIMEKIDRGLMRRWMQMAHAHHVNVELMRPTPKIDRKGRIDWKGFFERFEDYIDGRAFTRREGYVGPRAGQPVTRFVLPHADWWPSAPTKDKPFLPADPELWSSALNEWELLVSSLGWFARPNATEWIVFINSLDEPKTPQKLRALADYGPMMEAALYDRQHVSFRADGVLGVHIQGWSDERRIKDLSDVDLWNLHGATNTAPITVLQTENKRAMFYASNSGGEPAIPPLVVDSAIAGARAWGWIVARYHLAGALNWEIDFKAGCVADPMCSEGRALNLDATLIFRGQEVGRPAYEPIPSMRLKMLRSGAQDAALLSLLEAKNPDAARAIVTSVVPHALGDDLPRSGPGLWPKDIAAYDRARDMIFDALLGSRMEAERVEALEKLSVLLALMSVVLVWLGVRASRRG